MMKTTQKTPLLAVAVLATISMASAATFPKEGEYDYTACFSGTSNNIGFSKTHNAMTYEMMGAIVSKVPGSLFDKNTFRCVGMTTYFAGKPGGGNVCEAIDSDGDKRLATFSIGADGKLTRELVSGTGKYEGMTLTSNVAGMGPYPTIKLGTFQECNHQTGTYKLK